MLAQGIHTVQKVSCVFDLNFIGYGPHSLVALTICGWAATLIYLCCSLLHGHSCILPTEEFQKHQEKLTEHLAKSGFQGYPAGARWASTKGIAGAGRSSVVS